MIMLVYSLKHLRSISLISSFEASSSTAGARGGSGCLRRSMYCGICRGPLAGRASGRMAMAIPMALRWLHLTPN